MKRVVKVLKLIFRGVWRVFLGHLIRRIGARQQSKIVKKILDSAQKKFRKIAASTSRDNRCLTWKSGCHNRTGMTSGSDCRFYRKNINYKCVCLLTIQNIQKVFFFFSFEKYTLSRPEHIFERFWSLEYYSQKVFHLYFHKFFGIHIASCSLEWFAVFI